MCKRSFPMIATVLCVIWLISGCEILPTEVIKPGEHVVSPTSQKELINVTLYFSDDKAMGVVPEERKVPKGESLEKIIIQELIKGPLDPTLKPSLPKGIDIRSIDTIGGIAYVNFTGDVKNRIVGATAEMIAIDSIVFSLTELPDVIGVQFLIEGKREETIGGHSSILEPVYRRIKVGQIYNSEDRNRYNQWKASQGKEQWRFDPIEVAKRDGRMAGFLPGDEFELVSIKNKGTDSETGEAIIDVVHNGKSYKIQLIQPFGPGEDKIWVVNNVTTNFTEIPPVRYEEGERFIYGIVKEVDYVNRILTIERAYHFNPDSQVEIGVEIPVIQDAIIHIQKIIGKDEFGSYKRKEIDGEFIDIKAGAEVGMILTKDKNVRAVIVTPRE